MASSSPSPSTSQNHHHTATTATTTTPWGTLDELLLASAVNRYGTNSWDSIAKELQYRTSLSHFTPLLCQQKYRDLKRRFSDESARNVAGDSDAFLCLDELRRLRVAELRRELQRYDLSIVSLQLKVKKLKEETETDDKDDNNKNDDNNIINDVIIKEEEDKEEIKNEEKVDLQKNEEAKNEEEKKEEAEGDTWTSAESTRSNLKEQREVVEESEEGVKESSDVQSTVDGSDGNKVKKVGVVSGTSSGGGEEKENQTQALLVPLVEFLEVVRGRKLGAFFERRLLTQETAKYNNLIKQHIDLETIQKRLEEGQYTDCQTKFYRDVMLLINNAIIFFSKRSPEHKGALELRQLLNKQFQTHVSLPHDHKSQPSKSVQPAPLPKPTKTETNQPADLKQPKLTITGPVIACRKRSSIAGRGAGGERKERLLVTPPSEKVSSLEENTKQQGEKTSSTSFNAMTKKRTRDQSFGSRSSSSKSNRNSSPSTPVTGKGENSEAKTDKKKPSPGNSSSKLRQGSGSGSSRGKNTLLFESLKNSDKQKTGNERNVDRVKSDKRKDEGPQNGFGSKLSKEKAKAKEERENTLSKEKAKGKEERESTGSRSNRRPPKRAAAIAAMGKRGRDGGGESGSQSKKRQRK